MELRIESLSAQAFAPFGTVIEQPSRSADASGPGWQWWGELVDLRGGDRPYAIGTLSLKPAPLQFDWAERHEHSDELIVPMGDGCLVYVGPADVTDIASAPDRFHVFRLAPGQAVLLKPGVWHGAPLTVYQSIRVLIVLLHNTGRQDTRIARFEQTPVQIR